MGTPHRSFALHFPNDNDAEISLHMVICHLHTLFREIAIQILSLFVNSVTYFLLLSCKNSLYILNTSPYQIYDVHYFSHSLVCY